MARETTKYPAPKDPQDDRGYGPSWRDVSAALKHSHTVFGHEHYLTLWDGDIKRNPQPGIVFTLACGFRDCPVYQGPGPHNFWHRFPHRDFKTVPSMVLDIITRSIEAREGYLAQRTLPIFGEPEA